MKHLQSFNEHNATPAIYHSRITKGKTKVSYDDKKGVIIDTDVDSEKILNVHIKYEDGTDGWEVADDTKMKYI
jgi:hypothetical protein